MKKELIIYNLFFLVIDVFWLVVGYHWRCYKLAIFEGMLIGFILSNILHIVVEIKEND